MDNIINKVTIASDHAGFELKESIKELSLNDGFKMNDLGPFCNDSVDYPEDRKSVV